MPTLSSPGVFAQCLPYCDSFSLYRRLRQLPHPVLLSSGSANGANGRYDLLSAAPLALISSRGGRSVVEDSQGRRRECEGSALDLLEAEFLKAREGCLPVADAPFAGGVIGWFAYDLLHEELRIAASSPDDIGLPALRAGIYAWALVLDHEEQSCRLLAQPSCPVALREQVLACLSAPESVAEEAPFRLNGPFQSNFSRAEYDAACQRVIDYIHAGDCYQANLAQRFSAPCEGDPLAAFERLHRLANAPFSAFMEAPEGAVLSFSPERFISVRKGRVITQPIKGTRPRDADPARDQALLEDLQSSEKDRAENLMIVDLLRNDLGRVCSTGSVRVPALFEALSFRNVHHLVSTVEGRLDDPLQVFELLQASFPGGSITGAPKIRAMQIIDEVETAPRSVYCGSIAWIGFDGDMDSNICIRTLVAARGQVHCWGGGGIVADSVPAQEYQETLDKISLFLKGLS